MLKLMLQHDIGFVNKLLESIEHHGGCTDEKYKRVWVRLGTQGVILHSTFNEKKCQVVIFGEGEVDYTFAGEDGVQGSAIHTTVDDVDGVAKAIVNYFDKEDLTNV